MFENGASISYFSNLNIRHFRLHLSLQSQKVGKILNFGLSPMQNQVLPTNPAARAKRNAWITGFMPQAEIWNGRFAMIGLALVCLVKLLSR